jgi:periplasmic protein TonB
MRTGGSRFFAVSLSAHVIVGVAVASVRPEKRHEAVAIAFRDVNKPRPAHVAAPEDPEPPRAPAPHPMRSKAAPPSAPKAAPAPSPEASPGSDALPDFGLSLGGGGAGGIAVPVGGRSGGTDAPSAPLAKSFSRPSPKMGECADPPAKPRALSRPTPAYTEEARAAGISGKVRVEITVDEKGRVVSARILQGLGHGLDEAALAAARTMAFEPAVRCGRPSSATFKVGFNFAPPSP